MRTFLRKVKYYETDRMGITHHSNYVRWMEEARIDFLDQVGYGLKKLESESVTSPVVSVECRYQQPTTFDDEVEITVSVRDYNGVRLTFDYEMCNTATQTVVCIGASSHCFLGEHGRPLSVKKRYPELDAILKAAAAKSK